MNNMEHAAGMAFGLAAAAVLIAISVRKRELDREEAADEE